MTEMLLGQSSPRGFDPWGRECWRRTRWRRWFSGRRRRQSGGGLKHSPAGRSNGRSDPFGLGLVLYRAKEIRQCHY
jgi:hypothetical protein